MNYEKEFPSKFCYLPRIGEISSFTIKTIKKVESDNPRFNFSEITKIELDDGTEAEVKKDLGYHVECELEGGKILTVTSLGAFFQVFKKNDIQEGETVEIKHEGKGEWEVKKIA